MSYPVRSTSKVLKMSYIFNGGKVATQSLPDPRDDLTKNEVATVMNNMITDSALLNDGAEATEIKDAYIIETTKYDLSNS